MNPKNWYQECGDSIRAEFGADSELFIDLLAATSPRKQVSANWRLAMRIYHVWNDIDCIDRQVILSGRSNFVPVYMEVINERKANLFKGVMKSHKPNVIRALKREPLSGNKVRAFAANLKGNLDEVTIDVWVCRYFGWDEKKSMADKVYAERAAHIKVCAAIYGLKPAEYQAVIWYKAIHKAGKKPQSYLSVKHRHQMYFEFYMEVTCQSSK
jgi:hypothetical protein